jgi:hypothetical protein
MEMKKTKQMNAVELFPATSLFLKIPGCATIRLFHPREKCNPVVAFAGSTGSPSGCVAPQSKYSVNPGLLIHICVNQKLLG